MSTKAEAFAKVKGQGYIARLNSDNTVSTFRRDSDGLAPLGLGYWKHDSIRDLRDDLPEGVQDALERELRKAIQTPDRS
jgi:hypothetical protein